VHPLTHTRTHCLQGTRGRRPHPRTHTCALTPPHPHTSSTGNKGAQAISERCAATGVRTAVVGVPKSIDNDILLVRY